MYEKTEEEEKKMFQKGRNKNNFSKLYVHLLNRIEYTSTMASFFQW